MHEVPTRVSNVIRCATALLIAHVVTWSACSPAVAPKPTPSPRATASIDGSASDAAVDATGHASASDRFKRPPRLPGPFLPLTRTFRPVPPVMPLESKMSGWGDRVWFVAEGKLLEHDGKRLTNELLLCDFAVEVNTRIDVTSLPNGVLAKQFELGELGVFTQLTKDGRACHRANGSTFELRLVSALAARAITVAIPRDPEELLGVRLPERRPEHLFGVARAYSVGGSRWLEVVDSENSPGTWTFRATVSGWMRDDPPHQQIADMWADPSGTVWAIIGFYSAVLQARTPLDPGFVLGKHDGKRWSVVPVPEDFTPHKLTGSSATDLWFVGGSEHIFQFDGTHWHVGIIAAPKRKVKTDTGWQMVDAPEKPREVHMTESGVLWILTAEGRIYRADP